MPEEVAADDRHVVAVALAGKADGIVTNNVRDFAVEVLSPLELEVQTLDGFLVNQATLDDELVLDAIREIEADRVRPPRTVEELLSALEPIATEFVRLMRPLASTKP